MLIIIVIIIFAESTGPRRKRCTPLYKNFLCRIRNPRQPLNANGAHKGNARLDSNQARHAGKKSRPSLCTMKFIAAGQPIFQKHWPDNPELTILQPVFFSFFSSLLVVNGAITQMRREEYSAFFFGGGGKKMDRMHEISMAAPAEVLSKIFENWEEYDSNLVVWSYFLYSMIPFRCSSQGKGKGTQLLTQVGCSTPLTACPTDSSC